MTSPGCAWTRPGSTACGSGPSSTGKPLWQAALHLTTNSGDSRIDYGRAGRAPLLFIAGTADHIVPPKVNHKNAKAYKVGVVAVKEFEGRTHFIVGQDGWEEVADYALGWAESH
jgi:fermentation-respiration switch protein FrsA (DUF1100 family)